MSTAVCGVLMFASLLATRLWCRGSLFNPLTAFFGVWSVSLALYELDSVLGVFTLRLSALAEEMLSLSFVCVFLSTCIGLMVGLLGTKDSPDVDSRVLGRLDGITVLLFAVFATGVVWRYAITVSMYGLLLENLPTIREGAYVGELAVPTTSRVMTLAGYLVLLNLSVVSIFRAKVRVTLLIVATVVLNFVNDLTMGVRGATFNSVLLVMTTTLIALRVRGGRTRVSHVLVGGTLSLIVVLLMTSMMYLRSDGTVTFLERLLLDNFIYAVGPVPALTHYLDHPWVIDVPGQWTFAGIYQATDILLGFVGIGEILTPEIFHTYYAPITDLGPFNVASYVAYFYSDLGAVGVVLFSSVMGLASGYAFTRALRMKRVSDIQTASLLMFLLIFSVRGVLTNGVMFWVCLVFVALQRWSLARRTQPREDTLALASEVTTAAR